MSARMLRMAARVAIVSVHARARECASVRVYLYPERYILHAHTQMCLRVCAQVPNDTILHTNNVYRELCYVPTRVKYINIYIEGMWKFRAITSRGHSRRTRDADAGDEKTHTHTSISYTCAGHSTRVFEDSNIIFCIPHAPANR